MNPKILDIEDRVVFFPVRHHSPAAGRMLRQLAQLVKPEAFLIEGPSDFNSQIRELWLEHTLPIAIYSYAISATGDRRGAFYPYCIYSPEWQAIDEAKQRQCEMAFIDLPWSEMISPTTRTHRYSDSHLHNPDYEAAICREFGVDDFDALWERLIESDLNISLHDYLERCHRICYYMRACNPRADMENYRREQHMSAAIKSWAKKLSGKLIVVTGGFHSHALFDAFHDIKSDLTQEPPGTTAPEPTTVLPLVDKLMSQDGNRAEAQGISLTPYSYPLLDSLTGYNAGMPGPGFYHQAYEDSLSGEMTETYRKLLFNAVSSLRQRKQFISPADVIAVEQTAIALAALRGQKSVWRLELIDGVIGSLVKDEQVTHTTHPMELAIHEVFRGSQRGSLAAGTTLPPLVHSIRRRLAMLSLNLTDGGSTLSLNLEKPVDLEKSQVLHQLIQLSISGFNLTETAGLIGEEDNSLSEKWLLKWSVEHDADCITAAIYGATLEEAARNSLTEEGSTSELNALEVAALVSKACQMGLSQLNEDLRSRLQGAINQENQVAVAGQAISQLVHVLAYDRVHSNKPILTIGQLLQSAYNRTLWLLDILGQVSGQELEIAKAIAALLEAYERCGITLELDRELLVEVLQRASRNQQQTPMIRGGLVGALWVLGETSIDHLRSDLQFFRTPAQLGDFLTGLFLLAHDVIQSQSDLLKQIDSFVMAYDDEEFLEASPALRLAFTKFTPHEKNKMATSILAASGAENQTNIVSTAQQSVDDFTLAHVMAFESRVKKTLKRYGLRGGEA